MRTLKLTIAYDGSRFAGWQWQTDTLTVQGTLQAAIERVCQRPAKTLASGRTDAGVHALAQVVGVRVETALPIDVLHKAINANLPADIVVLDAVEVDGGFHPIRDAVGKRYRYTINDGPVRPVFWREYCWHFRHGRLDDAAMARAAEGLLGTHDFRSFAASGSEQKTSVRTLRRLSVERRADISAALAETELPVNAQVSDATTAQSKKTGQGRAGQGGGGDWLVIEAEADGFLYNMVRGLVGTLIEVGRGARSVDWPAEVLDGCDRRLAGPNAPPRGLCLVKVWYKDAGTR